jgi:L-serine dehydratase
MKAISIFNDVLGPVMRGPSSSHTAAPYQIGRMARALLLGPDRVPHLSRGTASEGERSEADAAADGPAEAAFVFDPGGSFAQVYREQGSDLGFAAGLLGWPLTDEHFGQVLDVAAREGVDIRFSVASLAHLLPLTPEGSGPEEGKLHPNTVEMRLRSRRGRTLHAVARSIGGGALVFTQVGGWPVSLAGDAHELMVEMAPAAEPFALLRTLPFALLRTLPFALLRTLPFALLRTLERVTAILAPLLRPEGPEPARQEQAGKVLLHARCAAPAGAGIVAALEALPGVSAVWAAEAIFFPLRGAPLFESAAEMVAYAEAEGCSLGEAALAYEAALLGLPPAEVLAETLRRFEVMRAAVHRGLAAPGRPGDATGELAPMQLLRPTAGGIFQAEREGALAVGGLHARAAARAMAVMHVNGGMGVVCAAPTAGSAGTIPGVMVTLAEDPALASLRSRREGVGDEAAIALALMAASAVGLVVARRATFAAEVAGCQVEIGAAGAMAAAAVVEAAGGSAQQAMDAAAIAFQNTMGLVCDMVQGIVEIPCHTRNAAAAANAFLCADLILGGYHNPIPLDETVDAVMAVGQMLPRELKVTALGGLALAPSARSLPRLR